MANSFPGLRVVIVVTFVECDKGCASVHFLAELFCILHFLPRPLEPHRKVDERGYCGTGGGGWVVATRKPRFVCVFIMVLQWQHIG